MRRGRAAAVWISVGRVMRTVSRAEARRIALGAQGFGARAPGNVGSRRLTGAIERLGLLQLDSVNVFERSHYLPLFARLGTYDRATLDRMLFRPGGRFIEYWAHEAAVIPVESWPLFRWRMADYREKALAPSHWATSNQPMLDWLRAELAAKGPLPASAIEHDANRRVGPWWGWSDVKRGLEVLFGWGEVVSAGRSRFQRTYALAEQVLPPDILAREVPAVEARRVLVAKAAEAHGIGTAADLGDYFRLSQAHTLAALHSLEEEGVVVPVSVEGWKRPAFMHRHARVPRRVETAALLSPFDPMVWARDRAERFFDFHYRIEIYTPAAKRVFGYYSLPILLDDSLVGRIDLKSDRQNGVLRVQSAWNERQDHSDAAARLAPLLRRAAAWQGLDDVEVVDRGTLARGLADELGVTLREPESRGVTEPL